MCMAARMQFYMRAGFTRPYAQLVPKQFACMTCRPGIATPRDQQKQVISRY